MRRQLIIEIISSLLIFLFIYTAFNKLLGFTAFKNVLTGSPLIGSMAFLVALAVPIGEALVAALLLIPRTRLWGLYGSFVLMTAFSLYLGYMLLFTPNLPCSCGGVLKQMSWGEHFLFNIFFLLLSILGIILERKRINEKCRMEFHSKEVYLA